ncbi:MAG: serine--tRNA ligase [Candidatus Woykebacteria bacterium]
MLDIKFIRENKKIVWDSIKKRRVDMDIDRLIEIDDKRLELIKVVEHLRRDRREAAEKKDIEKGRKVKEKLNREEESLRAVEQELDLYLEQAPNLISDEVPEGESEADSQEVKSWGGKPTFDFKPADHVQIGKELKIIDEESAAKVSGHGFYYLKDEGALLELALVSWVVNFLVKKGYMPTITPSLVRKRFVEGTGYLPRREEPDIYKIEGEDLYLVATAEITLAGLHSDQILNEEDLPLNYAGFSPSFRKEAGSYGKYAKGIFRVHQFDKVEIFKFVKPEDSTNAFKEIVSLEEEIYQALKIPYRIVNICSGEMSAAAYLKYDIEYWSPAEKVYREITSASNTTDYQARRLNIKYRKKDGSTEFVHTLNGTAVAVSRTIVAILENYQLEDGSVKVPEVLCDFLGKDTLGR